MAVNKVVRSTGETIIDISDSTAGPEDVAAGKIFYLPTGERSVGTRDDSPKRETVIPEQTITTTSNYTPLEFDSPLEAGVTYIYTINGVEYTGVAQEQYGSIMLGRWTMYQDGTGGVFDYSNGYMFFDTTGRSTYTVKVEKEASTS